MNESFEGFSPYEYHIKQEAVDEHESSVMQELEIASGCNQQNEEIVDIEFDYLCQPGQESLLEGYPLVAEHCSATENEKLEDFGESVHQECKMEEDDDPAEEPQNEDTLRLQEGSSVGKDDIDIESSKPSTRNTDA